MINPTQKLTWLLSRAFGNDASSFSNYIQLTKARKVNDIDFWTYIFRKRMRYSEIYMKFQCRLFSSAMISKSPTIPSPLRLITAHNHECSSANNWTIGYSTDDVIWRNDDKLPGTQTISWIHLHCPVSISGGVHEKLLVFVMNHSTVRKLLAHGYPSPYSHFHDSKQMFTFSMCGWVCS